MFVPGLFSTNRFSKDCCIHLRGYPYLHEPGDVTYSTRACDVMQDGPVASARSWGEPVFVGGEPPLPRVKVDGTSLSAGFRDEKAQVDRVWHLHSLKCILGKDCSENWF